MKKSVNYKILMLIPFFGVLLNSCTNKKANVFMGATPDGDTLLLKDIVTGEERLFVSPNNEYKEVLPYFHTGDTVLLVGSHLLSNDWYNNNRVFVYPDYQLAFYGSKIKSRKIQENIEKQQSVIENAKKSINQKQK